MRTLNSYKSQSAEAVNSAVSKIFANVSPNQVAQKFTKKLIKAKNAQGLKGLSASMEIRVSDVYRVYVSAAVFDYGRYIVDVSVEEKNGNRFMEFGTKHYDGENINLISFSQIFGDVEAAMYEIVDYVLYYNEKWAIESIELPKKYNAFLNRWEELTGLDFAEVVMGADPMPESEESAEVTEEDVINEVVGIINANLIENYTEGQKLDWSLFNDSTMEYLFANGGPELYEKIVNGVEGRRISEVLAYDDCFYVWYDDVPVKNDTPKLDGWVDGEWAWENDGTKPEAPADPEMKEWMESLGCKFEDDEDKYNVIAHCADGDVIIGKDGVNDVTLDVAKEIADAHKNMGVMLSIVKVEEIVENAPRLETETAEDAPILAYEEVKFWAEQFDLYNLYMGEENRHVEYRCAVEDNWYEYLLRGWNIDVEHTKEYWDKFWKIYCNVMHDLWGEEYNIAVDNMHDQLIFTPMIDENDAPCLDATEFLRERMPVIPIDIIKEGIADVFNDAETFYYTITNDRCDFNDFAELVWEKVWEKIMDADLSDEALENQTREWMEFEDRVRYILETEGYENYEVVVDYNNTMWVSEREENNDAPKLDDAETETKEQTETNVCCICGKTYEGYGNNADPLANGRCCDECNADVIKRRAEYLYAYNILNPMVEKLGDSRTEMFVSECEVDGVPVTLELMRPGDRYMVFVKTHHEKGYVWFRLFNDYLDYAYNN